MTSMVMVKKMVTVEDIVDEQIKLTRRQKTIDVGDLILKVQVFELDRFQQNKRISELGFHQIPGVYTAQN